MRARTSPTASGLRVPGRQNAILKTLRRCFHQHEPAPDGSVAIEGARNLEEAIRSSRKVHAVVFADTSVNKFSRLMSQIGKGTERFIVPLDAFREITDTETPQGVAALVEAPGFTLLDALTGDPPLAVAIVGLQDPGNLGTIVRSAEAFSASGVVLLENSVSLYNPKVIRATAGAIFRLPCIKSNWAEFAAAVKERGIRLAATTSHGGSPLHQADLRGPLALVIGNEGAGLDRALLKTMDLTLSIPQARQVESLNAGVAASVLLYEAARQRRSLQPGARP